MRRGWLPWALLGGSAVLLVASLFALVAWAHGFGLGNELSLPLLAIVGVVALLGALALARTDPEARPNA